MSKLFLAPAPGLSLPLPDGRAWPAAGDWVDPDEYVRRRLADGDLVEADPPPEPSGVPAEEAPAASAETEAPRRRTRS